MCRLPTHYTWWLRPHNTHNLGTPPHLTPSSPCLPTPHTTPTLPLQPAPPPPPPLTPPSPPHLITFPPFPTLFPSLHNPKPAGATRSFIENNIGDDFQMCSTMAMIILKDSLNAYNRKTVAACRGESFFHFAFDGASFAGEESLVIFCHLPEPDVSFACPFQVKISK